MFNIYMYMSFRNSHSHFSRLNALMNILRTNNYLENC